MRFDGDPLTSSFNGVRFDGDPLTSSFNGVRFDGDPLTSSFNGVRFDGDPFTCQCKKEDKKLGGFKFRTFMGRFQMTPLQ